MSEPTLELQEMEGLRGRVSDLESRIRSREEQLATAEAQRDEARHQLTVTENRAAAERLLSGCGVVDVETASMLLAKRVDLAEELDGRALSGAVEQLLLDKPFLRGPSGVSLPPKTAAARSEGKTMTARLTESAQRAATSGDRRDVAEYLRLRRQAGRT